MADSDGGDAADAHDQPAIALEVETEVLAAKVVAHPDGPDRRTVYPRGLSRIARMTTWLSADADSFVDLEDAQ